MRTPCRILSILLASALLSVAQVPQLINYQGRVAVGGTNFDGTGQFKFSLIEGSTTNTLWSNDGTGSGGAAPAAAVSLAVQKGLYSILLGDATLPNMTAVSSSVFTNSDVRLRVWFDDGAHGWQQLSPDQRIAAVGYAMMAGTAQTVPDGSITSAKIASGAVGSAHLGAGAVGADQLASGAALSNLNASGQSGVAGGGIILSQNENPELEAAGYVRLGITQIADTWQHCGGGAPPPPRRFFSTAWSGQELFVWGGMDIDINWDIQLSQSGARYDRATDIWGPISTNGAPSPRISHTAVWADSEMIVWGGSTQLWLTGPGHDVRDDGGRYNAASDSWISISTNGAPSPRNGHTAIWTGAEMIVWGGTTNFILGDLLETDFSGDPSQLVASGARYDPASDSWSPVSTNGAPCPRVEHTAIWTGTDMIVWGGVTNAMEIDDGGADTNYFAVAVNSGARYDPESDAWTPMSTNGAPLPRAAHTAVWTGSEMIVWGGWTGTNWVDEYDGSTNYSRHASHSGARYDPGSDSWTSISTDQAPSPRVGHSAVWTGTEMIVWGGTERGENFLFHEGEAYGDGARYSPDTDTWTSIVGLSGTPRETAWHAAAWADDEMLIFGIVADPYEPFSQTWTLRPAPVRNVHLYMRP